MDLTHLITSYHIGYNPQKAHLSMRVRIVMFGGKGFDGCSKDLFLYAFLDCMFYQLLHVQHSCPSTQSWGSVLPSIVETRDQNS